MPGSWRGVETAWRGVARGESRGRRGSGAAGGDDAHHALERVDRVAARTLHLGVGVGERLDRAGETLIRPALQVAAGAVDLPALQPEPAREVARRTARPRELRPGAERPR